MEIRVLGCSGGIAVGRRTTALLVDDDVLIDAGTGVGDLELEEMARIRHIFLTHSHLDHVASIPLLLDSVFDEMVEPVTIHARQETLRALQEHIFNWVIWPDFAKLPTADRPVLRYRRMEAGESRDLSGRRVDMLPVNHAVPAAGYRVSCPTGAFAFSGDTTTNEGFWEALNAQRLDLLFVETAFADQDLQLARMARHYCPRLLAEDLAKLDRDPEIYLSHLKPGAEEEILRQCAEHLQERRVRRLCGGDVFRL
jgi:ribonuclease BN (tRNA processing enzyme)